MTALMSGNTPGIFFVKMISVASYIGMERLAEEALLRVLHYCGDDATVVHNLAETAPHMWSRVYNTVSRVVYDNSEVRTAARFKRLTYLRFQHQVPLSMEFPPTLTKLKMPNEPFVIPPPLPNLRALNVAHNTRVVFDCVYCDEYLDICGICNNEPMFPKLTSLSAIKCSTEDDDIEYNQLVKLLVQDISSENLKALTSLREFHIRATDGTNLSHIPPNIKRLRAPHMDVFWAINSTDIGDVCEWVDMPPNWLQALMNRFEYLSLSNLEFDLRAGTLKLNANLLTEAGIIDPRIHTLIFTQCIIYLSPLRIVSVTIPDHVRNVFTSNKCLIITHKNEKRSHLPDKEDCVTQMGDLRIVHDGYMNGDKWIYRTDLASLRIHDPDINLGAYTNLVKLSVSLTAADFARFLNNINVNCTRLETLTLYCKKRNETTDEIFAFPPNLLHLHMYDGSYSMSNFHTFPDKLITLCIHHLRDKIGDGLCDKLPRSLAALSLPNVVLQNTILPPRLVTLCVRNTNLNLLPRRVAMLHDRKNDIYRIL